MKRLALALLLITVIAAAAYRSARTSQAQSNPAQPRLPLLYWPARLATAPLLKQAGIERFCVPPTQLAAWRKAGFQPVPLSLWQLQAREKLLTPRLAGRAQVASATSRPWIDANGWRFLRKPQGKFYYELPAGKAVLAAAEAFAYGADAILHITAPDPTNDIAELGQLYAFLRQLPVQPLPPVADIGVVEAGSPDLGEVLNLLARRNLLFRLVKTPAPELRLNLKLGTPEFPAEAAANPSDFALRVRRRLTDEQRSLRVYGSESVLCRLLSDGQRARVHLLNYSGREMESLRLRVRGLFAQGSAVSFGVDRTTLEDFTTDEGATEFSLGRIGVYTVVDLNANAK